MNKTHPNTDQELGSIARQAMIEAGFEIDLSADAQAELAAIKRGQSPDITPDIRDLRDRLWSSIDNPDSRDLDQIAFAEMLPDGTTRVLVGIADVDAFVPQGSALDHHAAANTTSVYTGIAVFPMLPEELSTGLSSLNVGEDRLAMVIDLVVAEDGEVVKTKIYRGLVRNQAKLDYESVGAWLEGAAPPPKAMTQVAGLIRQIGLQDRTMTALRAQRQLQGALDFETIEPRPIIKDGRVEDLVVEHKDRARALIEQMMISVNSAIATMLEESGQPSIARELPPPERWDRIVAIARRNGTSLPAKPDGPALAAFLTRQRVRRPATFPDLSLSIIKLLGHSHYQAIAPGADDAGHFGLAVEDYTHATAPNRRYSDLITQRLLKAAIARRPPPYTLAELEAIAERCTERAGAANLIERKLRKSTAVLLLDSKIGEVFEAIVTGVTPKGTFARLIHPPAEGRITDGEQGLDVGDRIRVRLTGTNLERGWIDFARI